MRSAVCPDAALHAGRVIGNGECAVGVELLTPGLGLTRGWRRGARVMDTPDLHPGTIVATFDPDGRYGNHTDGRSHVAVFHAFTPDGFEAWDQWHGQPWHRRTIHRGHYPAVNDADAYHVVLTEGAG